MTDAAPTATKVCTVCGVDVSSKPRTKSVDGKYVCADCSAKKQAAAKGASSSGVGKAAAGVIDPTLAKLLDASPLVGSGVQCSNCSLILPKGSKICLHCGFDQENARAIRTRVIAAPKQKSGSSVASKIDAGMILKIGVVLGVLSAVLAVVTPFGVLAALPFAIISGLVFVVGCVVVPIKDGMIGWAIANVLLGIPSFWYAFAVAQRDWLKSAMYVWLISWVGILAGMVLHMDAFEDEKPSTSTASPAPAASPSRTTPTQGL